MENMFLIFFVTVAFVTLANGLPALKEDVINFDYVIPAPSLEMTRRQCSCEKDHHACGCCSKMNIQKKIDAEVCMNASYTPSAKGADFFMTWDNHVSFNKTITGTHPPAICFDIPKGGGKACVKFSKVSQEKHHIGACTALEIKSSRHAKDIPLGCFFFRGLDTGTYLEKDKLHILTRGFVPSHTVDKIPQNNNLDHVGATDLMPLHESGCKCGKSPPRCDCCLHAKVFRFPINACVHADVDKTETGFNLAIVINSFKIVSEHISVADPPPICPRFGLFHKANVCLRLTDVSLAPDRAGACLELDINSSKKSFGCFYMKRPVDKNYRLKSQL
ncbi:uncharacterized protein [Montipora capricornis]|uniref:uncharacterized protein n=1 Tax=Montipora capricornis TaxID=246305 RepID=UPI0035F16513